MYRLTTNGEDTLGDAQKIGDRTLVMCHTEGLEFSTFSLGDKTVQLNNAYPVQISKQNLEVRTFAYFAYSKESQQIVYYINSEDNEQHAIESALHVVSSNYWFYLAKDALLNSYDSRLAQVVLNLGTGAFRKDNFKDLMVYLQSPKLFNPNAKLQWDYEDDELVLDSQDTTKQGVIIRIAEPNQKIESIQEYLVGLWIRFLQAWPSRLWNIPNEMQIFRLTSNEELENVHIWYISANQFGYKAFHGWIYDPRVFFDVGSFINNPDTVMEMVNKLNRKVPIRSQSTEGFGWPIKILDSINWDDIDEKKNELRYEFNDKQEMISYSIGFWYQNAPLLPEMEDEFRGLLRLTSNNEEVGQDNQFIGDRTWALFTKINELVAATYTIKDPSFESLQHSFTIKPYQWTFVYYGYHQHEVRAYILQPAGIQENTQEASYMIPNKLYLHLVNDIGHLHFGVNYMDQNSILVMVATQINLSNSLIDGLLILIKQHQPNKRQVLMNDSLYRYIKNQFDSLLIYKLSSQTQSLLAQQNLDHFFLQIFHFTKIQTKKLFLNLQLSFIFV